MAKINPLRFAKIPMSVLMDKQLIHRDIRIYGVLAIQAWRGGECKSGLRWIAEMANCQLRLASESVTRLIALGHVTQLADCKRGQKQVYTLVSPIFCKTLSDRQASRIRWEFSRLKIAVRRAREVAA